MRKFEYLRPRYVKQHFDSLVADGYYEYFMRGMRDIAQTKEDPISWLGIRLDAAIELVKRTWKMLVCDFRGHDMEPNGCDYIESGGEGFSCNRCGYSITAWH